MKKDIVDWRLLRCTDGDEENNETQVIETEKPPPPPQTKN